MTKFLIHKTTARFLLILGFSILFSACEKENPEDKVILHDAIIIGNEVNMIVRSLNSLTLGSKGIYIDFDEDGKWDIRLYSESNASSHNPAPVFWVSIECQNNARLDKTWIKDTLYSHNDSSIVFDTSLNQYVTYYGPVFTCQRLGSFQNPYRNMEIHIINPLDVDNTFESKSLMSQTEFSTIATTISGSYTHDCYFPNNVEKYIGVALFYETRVRLGWIKLEVEGLNVTLLEAAIQE